MLGEPSDKYGGGRFRAVGISYETLGLDIQLLELLRGDIVYCGYIGIMEKNMGTTI